VAQLTRDQIVSEGQLLAGRDNNETASAAWLQRWLDSVAASWPWPLLQDEAVGVALSSGATSLVVGNSGALPKLIKILDNVWLYNSAKTVRRRIRIRHQLGQPHDRISDTATNTGMPSAARIFNTSFGVWTLYFDVTPDQNYLLTIPYIQLPDAMSAGSDVPWYPNDETMVQAVAFKNHEFYDGKDAAVTQAAQQQLAGLVANDRIRYGSVTGINDSFILDPTRFRVKIP
jgi:hypothetical protein